MNIFLNETSINLSNINISKLTFYHGTNVPLKNFSDLSLEKVNAGDYGEGIYLTTNKDYAKNAGNNILKGNIYPNNPLIVGSSDYFDKIYPILSNNNENYIIPMHNLSKIAKSFNYDVIIIDRNTDDIWAIVLDENVFKKNIMTNKRENSRF